LPASHEVHADAEPVEYRPVAQVEHEVAPEFE